jgi:SNF2 family DNA or RNA helicase
MLLDYALDRFKLTIPAGNPFRKTFDFEIESIPYQTLEDSEVSVNGSVYYWSDNYTTVFDLITSEWYDHAKQSDAAEKRIEHWAKMRRVREIRQKPMPNSDDLFGYQYHTSCMFSGVDHLFINDGTGLGKTRSALACLDNNFKLGPNLIICPKIAIEAWTREIEVLFPGSDYITIVGPADERRKRLEHVTDVDFTIITYDLLIKHVSCRHWQGSKRLPEGELDGIKWNAVIADEAHRIKNPQALRTRCSWRISDNAVKRIALTATPITVDPQDLWGQLRFLSPKEFNSIGKFRDRFLRMEKNQHGGLDCLGWKEYGEMHYQQIMGWRTVRRTFESPEVQFAMRDMIVPEEGPLSIRHLDLTPMQEKAYKQMKDYLILSLKDWDGVTIAQNHLDMFIKLRQISNGMPVTTEDMKVIGLDVPSNKATACRDIVEDSDCNVVVFAEHSKVAGMIYRYLEDNLHNTVVRIITGDTRQPTRSAYIKEFQDDTVLGKKVLVCTTGTMSESVSLTNAGLLIFAQEPASMQQFIQCRGRVRRIGSNVVVPVISLRSRGTVEDKLAGKMSLKLDFLREYLLQMKGDKCL